MYGLTASSGVESMNSANKDLRKRSAVDLLNAGMILIKKEGSRFNRMVADAHKTGRFSNSKLTPRGIQIMDDIFKRCDIQNIAFKGPTIPTSTSLSFQRRRSGVASTLLPYPRLG